jgi:CRP/FNR family cyclic AMP-dependent transcriptional regulator
MYLVPILRRCEVFVGLDDGDLKKIAALPSWRKNTYNEGEFIFRENVVANDFYVLEDGEVRLVIGVYKEKVKGVTHIPVDTITKGDVFGWSSLVTPHSLTLSAVCVKPSTVLVVSGVELSALMDDNHSLGYEVMKGLVRVIGARLRDLRGRFVGKEVTVLKGQDICIE